MCVILIAFSLHLNPNDLEGESKGLEEKGCHQTMMNVSDTPMGA